VWRPVLERRRTAEGWLLQAVADGNVGGMYALGRLLVGLDRMGEALELFREAADLGDESARHALRVLAARERDKE